MNFKIGKIRKNSTASFGDIVSDILKEFSIGTDFYVESIRSAWSDIIGDILSTHSVPERIQRGILFIAVDHPVFANEIMLMKDSIIKKIEKNLHISGINSIRGEVKKIYWKKKI